MTRRAARRWCALAALGLLTVLAGCGTQSATTRGRSGESPISTGTLMPGTTTRPSPAPVPRPAAPGTAVLLQDHRASYTPFGARSRGAYHRLDPARPTLTVAIGTEIELRLTPGGFTAPTSSRPNVLRLAQSAWNATTAEARFRAVHAGTSMLTAATPPCPKAPVACLSPYRVAIRVAGG